MDSRIADPHAHNYDNDPRNAASHPVAEGEDAPEKMSMMNKVKAKAKKIKNTLTTKQGHGHDEEQDHDHDQDDEDEEINQVPEVHGASQKRNDTKITEPITKPHSPGVYGTKATNPTGTGGEAAGVTPMRESFAKMNVHDEPNSKPAGATDHNLPVSTGNQPTKLPPASHDQFSAKPVPPEAKAIRDPKPAGAADHNLPISTSNQRTKLPTERNDQFSSQFSAEPAPQDAKAIRDRPQLPESFGTTKLENKPHDKSGKPSNESRYESRDNATPKGQDKGASSVKNYVLGKLKPGEEDRALSGLISESLHKQREEPEKTETRPVGKVTESEEVSRRLGTEGENHGEEKTQSSYLDSLQGTATVVKLKGAVGSWFGLGGQESKSPTQVPQQPHGTSPGDGGISNSAERDVSHSTAEGTPQQQSQVPQQPRGTSHGDGGISKPVEGDVGYNTAEGRRLQEN
uniref:RD29B n=1 Tax=Betula platyphylla TaxID=78630 RepID=A0A7D7KJU0_BETPL|nr:RD29B [Betula platyphylla]